MKLTSKLLATAALLTASATAMAHPGHTEGGFTSGLLHPMLGLDHLLAMAAIGFWSVRQSKHMKNVTPAFVIGGMILGATLAWGGLSLPGVETGITFSVLVAGILIAPLLERVGWKGGIGSQQGSQRFRHTRVFRSTVRPNVIYGTKKFLELLKSVDRRPIFDCPHDRWVGLTPVPSHDFSNKLGFFLS